MYVWQHYPTSRFGFRTYIGASAFVRPVKRVQVVGVEVVGNGGRLYWCGWLPVWLATLPTEDKAALRVGNEYYWGGSKLVFLRGTLNLDKLLTDALAEYNHFQANSDGERQDPLSNPPHLRHGRQADQPPRRHDQAGFRVEGHQRQQPDNATDTAMEDRAILGQAE